MSEDGAPEIAVYTFRVPRPLLERLRAVAEKERRSLNSQMLVLMDEWARSVEEPS